MSKKMSKMNKGLKIGWGQEDITPTEPVLIAGLFHTRLSEGVSDPLTVTAWAIESGQEQAVFVSCDLIHISDFLRDTIVSLLQGKVPGLHLDNIVMNATHTHSAPFTDPGRAGADRLLGTNNELNLEAMDVEEYVTFAAEKVAGAVIQAWKTRAPGGISFGQAPAVVGRNRRWINAEGTSTMYSTNAQDKQLDNARYEESDQREHVYNLAPADRNTFRHVEGYEDHHIQVIATYDMHKDLTGLVVNVPCPSQESEEAFEISADWWHETRVELRNRFGDHLYILPQCSAAGDLSPHLLFGQKAHNRMLALKNRTSREEIGHRIADAVGDILPYIDQAIEWDPPFLHNVQTVELSAHVLAEEEVETFKQDYEKWQEEFKKESKRLEEKPESRNHKRWYVGLTYARARMQFNKNVIDRFAAQLDQVEPPKYPVKVHVLRLGEIAFATQPFECYLDFGNQIEVRSPATQTFLVQLAGKGTYLPSPRSVLGGGYGSTAASNPVGPEGGQQLVDHTVKSIHELWRNL